MCFLVCCCLVRYGQNKKRPGRRYNIENQVAIQGYDPVAYFKQGKAIKGQKQLSYYRKVYIIFLGESNKQLLVKPLAYEPHTNGAPTQWVKLDKVAINPTTFKIVNGKLYLFFHSFFNNI
jgi:hypothetical protein